LYKTKAVFLDKDGTLIENVPYNVDPALIRLMPGTVQGLRKLCRAGYQLIVVTNQSGVARGYFNERDLQAVEQRICHLLAKSGVPMHGFYYCPHHPQGSVSRYAIACSCRKPLPGLVLRAAGEHGIDLATSWVIGDILDDVETGRRSGCQTILIDNGHETEWVRSPMREPNYVAFNLDRASQFILAHERFQKRA
jgi:D-glycero-D-manno-heptose 1,7-bisphosphate phosphatase